MKALIRFMALLLLFGLLMGCTPVADTIDSTTQTQPKTEEEQLYEQLFSSDCTIRLELDMADTELRKLQADYETYSSRGSKSPIYRMADLIVYITDAAGNTSTYVVEQVGVRMKGNTSRTSFYSEEQGIYNLIHLKLSFQETFDDEEYYGAEALKWDETSRKERKNRTFATLEKLDLRWNKCDDATYIREHYAYEMFRAYGVLAPKTNLASVDWADLHMGVFTIYEPVDKVFLKRNLSEEQQGGDLYKCGWTSRGADLTGASSMGIEDEEKGEFYIYDLKTNKKSSTHERLTQLIKALNSGAMTKASLEKLVDVEYFLNFAAVSYFLGNPDDFRNNYNNCYLYFPPDGGCLVIPYDYDRCLGVTHEWDPTGNGVTGDEPFSLTISADGSQQKNPLYLYTVCQGGYYTGEYAQILEQISQSQWVQESYFASVFAGFQKSLGGLTYPGKTFWNSSDHHTAMTMDAVGDNLSIGQYFCAKLATLEKALANVDTTVDPQIPADLYIRAEFTNWDVWDGYELTRTDDGLYTYLIPGGKLKVYSCNRNQWFGSECLDERTIVPWETDGSTNIVLPEGRYLLIFDPQTDTITIENAP